MDGNRWKGSSFLCASLVDGDPRDYEGDWDYNFHESDYHPLLDCDEYRPYEIRVTEYTPELHLTDTERTEILIDTAEEPEVTESLSQRFSLEDVEDDFEDDFYSDMGEQWEELYAESDWDLL